MHKRANKSSSGRASAASREASEYVVGASETNCGRALSSDRVVKVEEVNDYRNSNSRTGVPAYTSKPRRCSPGRATCRRHVSNNTTTNSGFCWSVPGLGHVEGESVGGPSSGTTRKRPRGRDPPAWDVCVSESNVRPSEASILRAANIWYACGHPCGDDNDCAVRRCPTCWEGGGGSLQDFDLSCSRFKHGVAPEASSGLRRFKGGDVRSATNARLMPRGWAVGDGQGEDVEIFTSPRAKNNNLCGDGDVTLAKVLYFFDVQPNRRQRDTEVNGPVMEFVLVFEYVTCGAGRSKKEEAVTQHPTYPYSLWRLFVGTFICTIFVRC